MSKLYCIFAKESILAMNGNRGKLAAQAGHAFLHAFLDAEGRFPNSATEYCNSSHAYKIVLVTETVEALKVLDRKYSELCGASLITDAGLTVFSQPTTTCLGLGPISQDAVGEDLSNLKVLI